MDAPIVPDEDLVRRARAGDETAVQELFDRWLPAMRAQVHRKLRGSLRRRVAESDVVQEACLTAFLKMGNFEDRGDGSFGRWLTRILDLKLREEVRRHVGTAKRDVRVEASAPDVSPEALLPARDGTPSANAVRVEEAEALRRAMERLPEHYRNVLGLVHEQRLPMAEVGRLMARSEGAAGMLYARALRALARLMQPQGGS